MKVNTLLISISRGLDIVEGQLFGATSGHSKRVASICNNLGKAFGMNNDELVTLTTSALLHDSALTEWLTSGEADKSHCIMGQRNADTLPLPLPGADFVLYHHERSDGSGMFGLRDIPLGAEIISFADAYDCNMTLKGFLPKITDAFDAQSIDSPLPDWDVHPLEAMKFGDLIVKAIDYKSRFTRNHTFGIAQKAKHMAQFYGYDDLETAKLYLAACLHDLGKLATPTEVLEKPGRLTDAEFATIQEHIQYTFDLLEGVDDDIRHWAAGHHEKLDGSGYPFALKEHELHFNAQLMACIDIYQAVSEERPYHPARSHQDTMQIMHSMAANGGISARIVNDMDAALK
ncbi:MAG: HD domain-containing protein [Spirochaetes bacterium]|nr:HD domain-containing protein [Spirochaetota bacterium]